MATNTFRATAYDNVGNKYSNPDNALGAPDDTYMTCVPNQWENTAGVKADFAFNFSAIPAGAEISAVKMGGEYYASSANTELRLTAHISGSVKHYDYETPRTAEGTFEVDCTDKLTLSDIKNAGFRVQTMCYRSAASPTTFYIDSVYVVVEYTGGGETTTVVMPVDMMGGVSG